MISIVVPVHNAEKFLEETIKSVMAQTYTDWELLLVDDCSKDASKTIASGYEAMDKRIRLIALEENVGAAKARNVGIKESKGAYLAFLDADDIWVKEKLERELKFMKEKQAAFVFSGYEFADEQAVGTGKIVKVPETINYKQALKNTTIFTSTVLFDRSKIDKELLLMPDVKSEDTATWWQILKTGIEAYGLNENLVLYRRSANTLSSNKFEAIKRIWYLYRKVEKLNIFSSCYNFIGYAVRAVLRRV